jgi:S-DNA-T family DNA segregation ATPase FtsK/SpoIIIE
MLLMASVGAVIGKVLLALMMVIGLYITFDIPLASIIQRLRDMSVNGAMAARERLVSTGEERGGNGKKPEKVKPVKPLPEEPESEPEQKRKLLPIFVRKGDLEAEKAPVEPDKRAIPVSVGVGHTARPSSPEPEPEIDGDVEQAEFRLPPLSLLNEPQPPPQRMEAELKSNVEVIERTLEEFKVSGDVVEIAHGPTVTRYEIRLATGINVNNI